MLGKLFSKAGLGAALVAGIVAFGGPAPAEAAKVRIWIGVPGIDFWVGPGYYKGHYRDRLSCNEGKRIVDHRGFNSVKATDCVPRYYHYKAKRKGKWYKVRLDARTGGMKYWKY